MRESEDEKAVRVIAQGNSKAEVPQIDLDEFSKSDSRKIRIACRLRQETTMPLRWIVELPSDGECSIHHETLYKTGADPVTVTKSKVKSALGKEDKSVGDPFPFPFGFPDPLRLPMEQG